MAKSIPRNPLAISSTSLPKVPLSYRWTINDAKTFVERRRELTSPSFSSPLPCGQVSWRISLTKQEVYPLESNIKMFLEGSMTGEKTGSSVLFTGCSFSVLNSKKNKKLYAVQRANQVVKISSNFSTDKCTLCTSSELIKCSTSNDTLTIQVDATICCFNEPKEKVAEMCTIPVDNIRETLHDMYQDKVLADVTIKCGDKEFKAHKAILASQSPVFRKMFEADMKESKSSVVEIPDIESAVVSDLLEYIYSGEAPSIHSHTKQLLEAADKYQVSRLLSLCVNEMQKSLQVDNIIEILIHADTYNLKTFKTACLSYLLVHSSEVKRTDGWKLLKDNAEMYASLLAEVLDVVA